MARLAPVVILEGTWWSNHEVPLILPYFNALATSHSHVDLSHKTIRDANDIAHYVSKIGKDAGAFLYFACHGRNFELSPVDGRSKIPHQDLLDALANHKPGAIAFVHFGCCEMVDPSSRRHAHSEIIEAADARWASGYTSSVPWLQSTFLDLALVSEVFVPYHRGRNKGRRGAKMKTTADRFIADYEQLARALRFSALSLVTSGPVLFPSRLRG